MDNTDNNVLFVGQVIYTKSITKEYLRTIFLKTRIFWILLVLPIIMIPIGILLLVNLNDSFLGYIILGFGIFLILFVVIMLFSRHNTTYRILCEQNQGQEMANCTEFFKDVILVTNYLNGGRSSFMYPAIRRVIESKNLIILVTYARVHILIEKTKFNIGNPTELIAFIKSKKYVQGGNNSEIRS